MLRPSLALFLMIALVACERTVHQRIDGHISLLSMPVSQKNLRLYRSIECSGEFTEATTNNQGVFFLQSQGVRDWRKTHLRTLTLCLEKSGNWNPIWVSTHDGAVQRFELKCELSYVASDVCTAKMFIDEH